MTSKHPMSGITRHEAKQPHCNYSETLLQLADALDDMQARCDALGRPLEVIVQQFRKGGHGPTEAQIILAEAALAAERAHRNQESRS